VNDSDPELGNSDDVERAPGPEVEFIGDATRITEHFRKAAIAPSFVMNKRLRESLSSLDVIKGARENALKAAMGDLRKLDVAKIDFSRLVPAMPTSRIDFSGQISTRVDKPLKIDFPKPPPPVGPADIAAVAEAVNRQIDATEAQTHAFSHCTRQRRPRRHGATRL
jgi:hypothetical protein